MEKVAKAFIVFALTFTLIPQGKAAEGFELSKEVLKPFYQADEFLTTLGYKNFAALSEETLESEESLHSVAELVLEKNVKFYASLQSSKYMADLSYAFLVLNEKLPSEQQNKNIQLIINMAAQQIYPFPLIALEPVETPEYKIARGKEALEMRFEYLENRALERYKTEKENLLKTYTHLYQQLESGSGKSLSGFQGWTDKMLSKILWDQYTLSNMQQNRHLGRALVSVLVKYSREKNKPSIETRLRSQLQAMDVHLDDIITAKYRSHNKNEPAFQLKSGDIALEFSNGQDAFFTSLGVEPSRPENLEVAKKFDLISSYSNLPVFISQKYYDKALEKKKSNLVLNETEEKILVDFWNPKISKGYSHAGIVQVKTDPKTQISLAWVWDVYPNEGIGEVRLMSPDGFSYPERFIRIGFARYSPTKVMASYKKQIETRGYLEYINESKESHVLFNPQSKRNEPYVNPEKTYKWPAKITKKEVDVLLSSAREDRAEVWYQKEFLPKVFERLEAFVYTKDALAFATNLVNARSMAYCSQLVRLAFLEGTNFDPVPTTDQYRSLPRLIEKHFPEKAFLDTKGGFVAPAGLVWQADIVDSYVHFDFTRDRALRQTWSRDIVDGYTRYLGQDPSVNAVPLLIKPQDLPIEDVYVSDDLSL